MFRKGTDNNLSKSGSSNMGVRESGGMSGKASSSQKGEEKLSRRKLKQVEKGKRLTKRIWIRLRRRSRGKRLFLVLR